MMSLLCSSPGLVMAAEIYWDTPTQELEINDSDFSQKYDGQSDYSLFREKDIYQVWKPGLSDEGEEPQTTVSRPIQEPGQPATILERRVPTTVRPDSGTQNRTIEQARPSSTTNPPRVSPAAPRQAETVPGSQDVSPAATQESVEKPGTKKMKWGQSDSSSSEPKTKFEWGQNKSGN